MALDWKKDISFSGLRKAVPKVKETYPSKTFINLAISDQRTINLRRLIPTIIITVIVALLIGKFAVYDFISQVINKNNELIQKQQALTEVELKLTNFDAVWEEYQSYVSERLSSDVTVVSATEALDLIDSTIASKATVTSADFGNNKLSLNLTNITLDGLGNLVSALYQQPIVADVTVSTAATSQTAASDVSAAMIITLQEAGDAQ